MAHLIACVMAPSLMNARSVVSMSGPGSVPSWYDAGIRLRPVHSWYDSGTRLVAWWRPLEMSSEAATAIASGSDLGCPNVSRLTIKQHIGEGTQGEVMLGELPGMVGQSALKLGLRQNAISREPIVLSAISGADPRGYCIMRPDCDADDA